MEIFSFLHLGLDMFSFIQDPQVCAFLMLEDVLCDNGGFKSSKLICIFGLRFVFVFLTFFKILFGVTGRVLEPIIIWEFL